MSNRIKVVLRLPNPRGTPYIFTYNNTIVLL